MLKAVSNFFNDRKKTTAPSFKDFDVEWLAALTSSLLPSLRRSISESDSSINQLSTHVESLHRHLQSYYAALGAAAQNDSAAVAPLLFPAWRSPLEKPFLFLGDLHPYLLTNLLRSLILSAADDGEDDSDVAALKFDEPWHIATEWRSPSGDLLSRVEQIERGLRLMVPALASRARDAQGRFLERVGRNWTYWGPHMAAAVGKAMAELNEEMVGVFVDANRLRKSVLVEIMGALSVYQGALFLEGLAQFLVGFRDPELVAQLEHCKTPLDKHSRLAI